MASNFIISRIDGIDFVEFFEPPGFEVSRDAIAEVNRNDPSKLRLWDVTMGAQLAPDELQKLAEFSSQFPFQPGARVAYVAREDQAYGIARLFEAYRDYGETEHEVFRSREQAISWLKAGHEGTAPETPELEAPEQEGSG